MDSIDMPRIHHQLYPNLAQVEHGFSPTILRSLRAYLHEVFFPFHLCYFLPQFLPPQLFVYFLLGKVEEEEQGYYRSVVQGVYNDTDLIVAASDPRKGGAAAGF